MQIPFGEFELTVVSDGTFRLDGGAMFGIVPKVLWEKTNPSDDRNRIHLGLNCLLVRTADETILIDTGIGDLFDDKFSFLYGVDKSATLLGSLAAAGVCADEVNKVVLTHLHFDHCGGNCRKDAAGNIVPTFANAVYYVDEGELAVAASPDSRSRASYLPHTWQPLEASGQLSVTSGNEAIVPGVELLPTPGHTEHHQSVLLKSEGRMACFLADLAPTPSHLKTNYVMGFDLFPKMTMKNKEEVLGRARREEWLLFFEHAPADGIGYLDENRQLVPVV